MKKTKLIIFLILVGLQSFAQDFCPFVSDATAYYTNSSKNVQCVRFDSILVKDSYSILYPFAVIQTMDFETISPSISSWIGRRILVKDGGDVIIYNRYNEEILIKTDAKRNESWIVFEKGEYRIRAYVTDVKTQTFLGISEPVKTIVFVNEGNEYISSVVEGYYWQLSENHGFINLVNLDIFPYEFSDPWDPKYEEYKLSGFSNSENDIGIQNLKWFDVYDFSPGDELHIRSHEDGSIFGDEFSFTEIKTIKRYLNKEEYPDSMVYTCYQSQIAYSYNGDSLVHILTEDTISEKIQVNNVFDKLPGEPFIVNENLGEFVMKDEQLSSKTEYFRMYSFVNDSVWHRLSWDGCLIVNKYLKGLGGPYYYCSSSFGDFYLERKLVYNRKGDSSWGTPLDLVTNLNQLTGQRIEIYPNPADDYLIVRQNDLQCNEIEFYIFDVYGKKVKSQRITDTETYIDVKQLPRGVYIYKISRNQVEIQSGRLIINNKFN